MINETTSRRTPSALLVAVSFVFRLARLLAVDLFVGSEAFARGFLLAPAPPAEVAGVLVADRFRPFVDFLEAVARVLAFARFLPVERAARFAFAPAVDFLRTVAFFVDFGAIAVGLPADR